MFAKLFNAFIFGSIFILLLDFLLFVGLKLNYFDHYGIDEYFNTIFSDNQPYILLIILSVVIGYAMLYLKGSKIFDRFYIVLILLFATTFYQPIGQAVGEILFIQKAQKLTFYDTNTTADILYHGRESIYIKKPNLNRAAKIAKEDLIFQ